ncbi:MAG TPA: DMT family transporter [Candidatus Nanopelagicaceae bacterium]|nr:DMT family transporter [Candidatus Nanopelagicaceae bacterium]
MTRRVWLLFLAMCLIWGLPYLLIRVSVRAITPAELVFGRTAIGAAVLLPLAARRGQLRVVLPHWRPLLAYTAVEIAIPWLLLSDAERHISSSLSGLLVAAVPLVGTALAWATGFRQVLGPRQLTGLLIGLLGVGAVLGFDLGTMTPLAGVEMAVVIICYATGPQILSRRLAHLPGLGVVAFSLVMGAVAYLPVAVWQHPRAVPSGEVMASVAVLGLVCTALAFVLFFELIRRIGAVRATVITYVNPAVAVALGVVLLHESFTAGTAIGFGLILVGSALATRVSPPPRRDGQPTLGSVGAEP